MLKGGMSPGKWRASASKKLPARASRKRGNNYFEALIMSKEMGCGQRAAKVEVLLAALPRPLAGYRYCRLCGLTLFDSRYWLMYIL